MRMRWMLMLTEVRKIFGARSQNTLCDRGLLRGNGSSGMIQIVYHSVCAVELKIKKFIRKWNNITGKVRMYIYIYISKIENISVLGNVPVILFYLCYYSIDFRTGWRPSSWNGMAHHRPSASRASQTRQFQ